ncbi:MAG: class I SAM-dependent methyltransferase [Candidatus Aceula lacicola]|nr:class I SAM-dependent methyltransferase [Candidatus Aceula lacicola]
MEEMKYLCEVYELLPRCGPGDNESTRRAFNSMLKPSAQPLILDIGCGSGMQTLELARISKGKIIALDNHQGFLDILMKKASEDGLEENIIPKNISMLEMDFDPSSFDTIWSEGALYCMGFQNGLKRCRQLLKDGGYLAVTELVYIVSDPPIPVVRYWESEYLDIKDVKSKVELIENEGFQLLLNFTLPESSWLNNYYLPMERELPELKKKYQNNKTALGVFESFQREVDFYKKYSKYYGYEFFVMQKK